MSENGHGPPERALDVVMIASPPERQTWELHPNDDLEQQLAVRRERLRFLDGEGEAA